jgi:hypothetical protein
MVENKCHKFKHELYRRSNETDCVAVPTSQSFIAFQQGLFCDGTCRDAVPEVLSQKGARRDGFPELFPGIDITNTSPSPTEF